MCFNSVFSSGKSNKIWTIQNQSYKNPLCFVQRFNTHMCLKLFFIIPTLPAHNTMCKILVQHYTFLRVYHNIRKNTPKVSNVSNFLCI